MLLLVVVGIPACSHPSGEPRPEAAIRLNDSMAAVQLEHRLPLSMSFDDRMGVAQVAELPSPLELEAVEPPTEFRAGDAAYWAAEQSIVVFLSDGHDPAADGLVLVGHVTAGLAELADCTHDCRVRLVDAPRRSGPSRGDRARRSHRIPSESLRRQSLAPTRD